MSAECRVLEKFPGSERILPPAASSSVCGDVASKPIRRKTYEDSD
jgi:hypothetical protein